jgi:hypothetical protein
MNTYQITHDGKAIKCLACGLTSHNDNDVHQRYCVRCHVFHNDIPADTREVFVATGLLFRLARHIRNTNKLPPVQYGVRGVELLVEVQEFNPERYDKEVKS